MASTISLGLNTYNLIQMPAYPGLSSLDLTMEDSVAVSPSPFVPSQVQTQAWPGADSWSMTITTPKMAHAVAANWRGFIAELRGMENVFQIGDSFCTAPLGAVEGAPVAYSTGINNLTSGTTLDTEGWAPSVYGQLLPGDYIQIGYRLHQVCEPVNSDAAGKASIIIWPSLRETPPMGTPLILHDTVGLFRLASNTRTSHNDFSRLTSLSLKCMEVR